MPKKTTKKTTKTVAKRTVRTQAAPVAETCACGHDCPCHRCGKFKKFVAIVIVFFIGFAVAKLTSCPCRHNMNPMLKEHPVFTAEGCLDMSSIKCPKMAEDLTSSEANADNCITQDEFFAMRKEMMKKFRHHHKGPKPMEPKPTEEQPKPENM